MLVIGVTGFKGSGKDTVGNFLVENGFTKLSFATILKDISAQLFGWPRHLLEGDTKESRDWREEIDPWWSEKLGNPNFTRRLALQLMGTEVMRKGLHDDIWILCVERQILQSKNDKFVITDCRFPNELRMIHNLGGVTIRVKRGPEPEWYDTALGCNTGSDIGEEGVWRKYLEDLLVRHYKIHASERDWIGYPFDFTINNDGTLEDLKCRVHEILSKIHS
jgi:hypothetical protein